MMPLCDSSFDPVEWRRICGELSPNAYGNWESMDIVGPADACRLMLLREKLSKQYPLGSGTPTDLFVLSAEESSERTRTKVGGLPYWPKDRPWPVTSDNQPLPFLVQVDYHASLDMVGSVPERMLLLFGWDTIPDSLVAHWQPECPSEDLVSSTDVPVSIRQPCLTGSRWRTETFSCPFEWPDRLRLEGGNFFGTLPFLCQPLGIQIGANPFLIPWLQHELSKMRIVFSMCTIVPKPDLEWPFLNREAPLSANECSQYLLELNDSPLEDGFGVVYVIQEATAEPIVLHANL